MAKTQTMGSDPLYAVIDIETANSSIKGSICSIGIVYMQGFEISDTFYTLINPECPFSPYNTNVHGITNDDVKNAPLFIDVWERMKDTLSDRTLICYNASFDINVLKQALGSSDCSAAGLSYFCAYQLTRRLIEAPSYSLSNISESFGIMHDAHNALEDALATSALLRAIAEMLHARSIDQLLEMAGLECQFFDQGPPSKSSFAPRSGFEPRKAMAVEHGNADYFIGKSVVFTGDLSFASREAARIAVREMGGSCKSSVSKKTDIVIRGSYDPATLKPNEQVGSKLIYAQELIEAGCPIQIIDEQQFLSILRFGIDPMFSSKWW